MECVENDGVVVKMEKAVRVWRLSAEAGEIQHCLLRGQAGIR